MADKRAENGGHSTKTKEGVIDKRKNEYKEALQEASTKEDVIKVIQMIYKKSIDDRDVTAAKLFLEYYLGKPKDTLDVTTNGDSITIPTIYFKKSE
jgi:hypothetical protein